jgi:LPXTG-site transpeptidase (sortase) family protein
MFMASDTLNLDGFRRERQLPIAAIENFSHPEAVEAARARIADLAPSAMIEMTDGVPSLPTGDLVTNKEKLHKTLTTAPVVKTKSKSTLPSIIQPVLTAAGIFLLILVIFKSPVIFTQIKYNLSKPAPAAPVANAAAATIIPADPSLTIPKINVHAPVVYEPSTNETTFETALQSGVVHYGNTAVPGQNGNVAIFGHSSNDWWQPGNYKFVFVLLDKLVPGDKILIDYQSKRYTYEVTGSSIVDPTDVAVLDQTPTPTISLITCTPPGTSWKRLVVTAKQIDPAPDAVAAPVTAAATSQTTSIPSGSTGFGHQIKSAFSAVVNSIASLFGIKQPVTNPQTSSPAQTSSQPASLPLAN